jgi:serine/threonine protein kinase
MVADDRLVKVLDFGVAKLADPSPIDSDNASTRSVAAETLPGSILGTVEYMSPEQVEAKPLDARSDIFSFGLTLYEMVTGEHPFRHGSSLSTVSSILNDSPKPVSAVRLDVPRDLEKIIARCLRAAIQTEVVQLTNDTGLSMDPAVSADGKLLAYASDAGDDRNLNIWIQQLGEGGPTTPSIIYPC